MITTSTMLNTGYGEFKVNYHQSPTGEFCISFVKGDVTKGTTYLRVHSACIFGEAFMASDCDCRQQLHTAMKTISEKGSGVIIYLYQEGRGVGLEKKIQAIDTQHKNNMDTVEAFTALGFPLDCREYSVAVMALNDLQISKDIHLLCNNPRKKKYLVDHGIKITAVEEMSYKVTDEAEKYLETKREKLGHQINFAKISVGTITGE